MTVVVYKDCRIEIERDGKTFTYSIWDNEGYMVATDYVELSKKEVIEDCKSLVDEYIKTPDNFR